VGAKVRITTPLVAPEKLQGELVAVRGDTLVIRRDVSLQVLEIPLSQVDRLELRRERSQFEGLEHGLLIGVPAGIGSGYLYGWVLEGGFRCRYECGLAPLYLAVAGGALGTVLGAIFGLATPGGTWVAVARAAPAPAGGVALSLRVDL
jgi:hypothetical protein